MDYKLLVKAVCGLAAAVVMGLTATHNIDSSLAASISGGIAMVLSFFTANDHNTAS